METSCLFCLESLSENSTLNPIGCQCTIQAHTHCLESWFHKRQKQECPICHTTSVSNPLNQQTVILFIQSNPDPPRIRFRQHDKVVAGCCCILFGWAIALAILDYLIGKR